MMKTNSIKVATVETKAEATVATAEVTETDQKVKEYQWRV